MLKQLLWIFTISAILIGCHTSNHKLVSCQKDNITLADNIIITPGAEDLLLHLNTANISKKMHAKDKALAIKIAYNALEYSIDNVDTNWAAPNSLLSGQFKIIKTTGKQKQNLVCREFIHTIALDKHQEQLYGQACRNMWGPKGKWILQGIAKNSILH